MSIDTTDEISQAEQDYNSALETAANTGNFFDTWQNAELGDTLTMSDELFEKYNLPKTPGEMTEVHKNMYGAPLREFGDTEWRVMIIVKSLNHARDEDYPRFVDLWHDVVQESPRLMDHMLEAQAYMNLFNKSLYDKWENGHTLYRNTTIEELDHYLENYRLGSDENSYNYVAMSPSSAMGKRWKTSRESTDRIMIEYDAEALRRYSAPVRYTLLPKQLGVSRSITGREDFSLPMGAQYYGEQEVRVEEGVMVDGKIGRIHFLDMGEQYYTDGSRIPFEERYKKLEEKYGELSDDLRFYDDGLSADSDEHAFETFDDYLASAGKRKYDETKYRRDAKGRYARKDSTDVDEDEYEEEDEPPDKYEPKNQDLPEVNNDYYTHFNLDRGMQDWLKSNHPEYNWEKPVGMFPTVENKEEADAMLEILGEHIDLDTMGSINRAHKKALAESHTVYRGMSLDNFETYLKHEGKIGMAERDRYATELDFVSTTLDSEIGKQFAAMHGGGVTLVLNTEDIPKEDIDVVDYQKRPDFYIKKYESKAADDTGEFGLPINTGLVRIDERFNGSHAAQYYKEREVRIRDKRTPKLEALLFNKDEMDKDEFVRLVKIYRDSDLDVPVYDNDGNIVNFNATVFYDGDIAATGVKAVDHLLSLLNNLGAAGKRKFDENKHKRDIYGRWAKKDAEALLPDDTTHKSPEMTLETLLEQFPDKGEGFDDFIHHYTESLDNIMDELNRNANELEAPGGSMSLNLSFMFDKQILDYEDISWNDFKQFITDDEYRQHQMFNSILANRQEDLVKKYPAMKKYVQAYNMVQTKMDEAYERKYNDAEYLYRGTSLDELESISEYGIGPGGDFNYANFSVDQDIARSFTHWNVERPIVIRLNKDHAKPYTTSQGYTLAHRGDAKDEAIDSKQGWRVYHEQEHRVMTQDPENIDFDIMILDTAQYSSKTEQDNAREILKERFPFVKTVGYGEWGW